MFVKPNNRAAQEAGPTLIAFNWIAGKEVEGDLPSFESRSSADHRDIIAILPEAGARDVDRAVRAAGEAFAPWRAFTPRARVEAIQRFGMVLSAQQEKIARLLVREIGMPWSEARAELAQAIALCQSFDATQSGAWSTGDGTSVQLRAPMGILGLITSGTSPVAHVLDKLLPALVAGNTLVWKPSHDAAGVSYVLSRAMMDAGLPPGVVNVIQGKGRNGCGKHLLAALERGVFHGFGFAGSTLVGRTVAEMAGRHLVTPMLDLPGVDAMVVMADADLDLALERAIQEAFGHAGQRAARLANLVLHAPIADAFQKRFLEHAAALPVGNPLHHPEVMCGAVLNAKAVKNFEDHVTHAQAEGATLLLGGQRITEDNRSASTFGSVGHGSFLQPTVWGGVTPDMGSFQREVFAPTVNLVVAQDFNEALRLTNASRNPLLATIFSADSVLLGRFARENRAGTTLLNPATEQNGPSLADPLAPFAKDRVVIWGGTEAPSAPPPEEDALPPSKYDRSGWDKL